MHEISDRIPNYIGAVWRAPSAGEYLNVTNPATAQPLAQVPLSPPEEVDRAVQAAHAAFQEWRRVPPVERIQFLFRLKNALEEHFEDLARTVTMENGKTLSEARGEFRRAIENLEVACGIPTMMQGGILEDAAPGIDEFVLRQPLGVCAIIAPFNFPGMIPFWFLPYALACGNTVVVKPSEKTPLTMQKVFRLLDGCGLPPGVANLINGSAATVDALLDHPDIRAISFVGSTPVARHVYSRASAAGKRVQAQGGAKNPVIVLPDADLETTTQIVADSAFGCAGQRCLAASLAITVGAARPAFGEAISAAAEQRVIGYGLDPDVQMGPVISRQSKKRIEGLIVRGAAEGAQVLAGGTGYTHHAYERGSFVRPTVLDNINPDGHIASTEIFGPVLGLIPVATIEQAIDLVNRGNYGNMASIFTTSGAAARKFRNQVEAGNVGINIGVAAPMAFFPFSGWKDSFFGALHGQGQHAVEFFTQTKVVVERWPKEWRRTF